MSFENLLSINGDSTVKISFVGGGAMAEAIIAGVLRKKLAPAKDICVGEPVEERRATLSHKYKIHTTVSNIDSINDTDLIVLSIKPQQIDRVLKELLGRVTRKQTVVSILAGTPLKKIKEGLKFSHVVRVMPNTPAQIGEGMSVWTADTSVDESEKENVRSVLQTLGHEIYMKDESYLDIATALSGSGPAYVFLFIESLADAGIQLGINEEVSYKLALQTVLGSAKLVQETGKSPMELRHMVTSPHGTTEAAIKDLNLNRFQEIIFSAVHAAYKKSRELGV
jgi:pyrroline-5-carboxylate reductase